METTKCTWKTKEGKRCKFASNKNTNYCNKHYYNYVYMEDGLKSNNIPIVCQNTLLIVFKPKNIEEIMIFKDHEFIDSNKVIYTYENKPKTGVTYITMNNTITGLDELFWSSREDRKSQSGRLVKELTVKPYKESCENDSVICINGECLCEECFEKGYDTLIEYMKQTKLQEQELQKLFDQLDI